MADATPERRAYLPPHARSNATNWRVKDETPRADDNDNNNNNYQRRQQGNGNFRSPRIPSTPDGANFDNSNEGASPAGAAGTRLYVGNLLYTASREDVEGLFTSNGFNITGISMSIDPFTGRNPSYAFVDFETADEAARAMDSVTGQELMGREVRVNPGVRKQSGQGGERRVRNYANDGREERTERGQGYAPAYNRFTRTDGAAHSQQATSQGLRLYVGNLPRIEPHSACEETIQQLFNSQGFQVSAVSKMVSPHPSKAGEPGNHYYCFVDMGNAEDADGAIAALNGAQTEWGDALRVGRARDNGNRKSVREGYEKKERDGPRAEEASSWR